ncbi:MAG: rhamnulokinase family protein [Chloroflexota bacterium]
MTAEGNRYLAVDLGAESGRVMLTTLDNGRLAVEEIYRFGNAPARLPGGLHWDVLHLWNEIKTGIALAGKRGVQIDSIGVDTWGVDFALLDRQGNLIGNPYHYRDTRTAGMLEAALQRVSREEIFAQTGIQFMPINSLYQLFAMVCQDSPWLEISQTFLMIPDLFHYWLSGVIANEFTNATTTQCYDTRKKSWATPLLERLRIPTHIFQPVFSPGTVLGDMLQTVSEETGCPNMKVVLPATHDTGSAVAAVPAPESGFGWISSGTWSIVGVEIDHPVVNDEALNYNFTNEGGVENTWRLSRNVMGLWLIQECRRTWISQGLAFDYEEMSRLASRARPFVAVVDPDFPEFLYPGDMPKRIVDYCVRTGQTPPQDHGEVIRVILESIALKYRWVIERLERVIGKELETIYIVGGGTKNRLLNQFTADATGCRVVAGPSEATSIGNAVMQAVGLGHLKGVTEGRAVIRSSFSPEMYLPVASQDWDKAYNLLDQLVRNYA